MTEHMACAKRENPQGDPEIHSAQPAATCIRVSRTVRGESQCLFTYAGNADTLVIQALLQHIEHLTALTSGRWRVEVIASDFGEQLIQQVKGGLRALQRRGLRPHLQIVARIPPAGDTVPVGTPAKDSLAQRSAG